MVTLKKVSYCCYHPVLVDYLAVAPTFKLIGNSMVLGTLEILAEAYTVAEKSGIGAEKIHSFVQGNTFLLSM